MCHDLLIYVHDYSDDNRTKIRRHSCELLYPGYVPKAFMLVIISGLSPEGICASCYIRAKTRGHLCELLYPAKSRRYLGLEVSDLAVIISINTLIKYKQ